jgi:hypothetical protein
MIILDSETPPTVVRGKAESITPFLSLMWGKSIPELPEDSEK